MNDSELHSNIENDLTEEQFRDEFNSSSLEHKLRFVYKVLTDNIHEDGFINSFTFLNIKNHDEVLMAIKLLGHLVEDPNFTL